MYYSVSNPFCLFIENDYVINFNPASSNAKKYYRFVRTTQDTANNFKIISSLISATCALSLQIKLDNGAEKSEQRDA